MYIWGAAGGVVWCCFSSFFLHALFVSAFWRLISSLSTFNQNNQKVKATVAAPPSSEPSDSQPAATTDSGTGPELAASRGGGGAAAGSVSMPPTIGQSPSPCHVEKDGRDANWKEERNKAAEASDACRATSSASSASAPKQEDGEVPEEEGVKSLAHVQLSQVID